MHINLWNPVNSTSVYAILLTSLLLGIIHGFTPDEHTWPITFSYSIGSYSVKGGFKTGLLFSAAFTLQRAIASELAYFALANILTKPSVVPVVYMFVGIVMSFAGAYIIGIGKNFEFFEGIEKWLSKSLNLKSERYYNNKYNNNSTHSTKPIPIYLVLLHGFIAGWGTGAFAIIIYTVLAPQMPNAYIGFMPGLFFGLGTMLTQIIIGTLIGRFMQKRNITEKGIQYVARKTSGLTLFWGGLSFIAAAILEFIFPQLIKIGIITPIKVHNLHNIGIGFFLVIFIVLIIMATSLVKSFNYVKKHEKDFIS
jgi:sulfite exporter TauE/SafE